MNDANLFVQTLKKPSTDHPWAVRLNERFLAALDNGDFEVARNVTDELEVLYNELWRGKFPRQE